MKKEKVLSKMIVPRTPSLSRTISQESKMKSMNSLNVLAAVCVNERHKRKVKIFRVLLKLVSHVSTKEQHYEITKILVSQSINNDKSGKTIVKNFKHVLGDKKWGWVIKNTRAYAKSF